MRAYLRPIAVVFTNRELRRLQLAWAGSSLGTCAYLIALAVVAFRSGGAAGGRPHHARPHRRRRPRVAPALGVRRPLPAAPGHGGQRPRPGGAHRLRSPFSTAVMRRSGRSTCSPRPSPSLRRCFGPRRRRSRRRSPETPVELTASNAVAGTIESASIFLGPGIGGIVLAVSGIAGVFVVCVIAFLWSACARLGARRARGARDGRGRPAARRSPLGDPGRLPHARRRPPPSSQSPSPTPPRRWSPAHSPSSRSCSRSTSSTWETPASAISTAPSASAAFSAESPRSAWRAHAGLAAAFAAGVLAWGVGVALLGATTSTAVALVLLAGVGDRQHGRRRGGGDAASALGRRCRPRPGLRRARDRAPVGRSGSARSCAPLVDPPARHPRGADLDRARPSRRRGRVRARARGPRRRRIPPSSTARTLLRATPDLRIRSPRARWSSSRGRSSRSTQSRAPR